MNMIIYMLKVSLSVAVFWSLYRIFLRRFTFFRLNRQYLIGTVLLSFLLPVFPLHLSSAGEAFAPGFPVINWQQFEEVMMPQVIAEKGSASADLLITLPLLYLFISGFFITRILIRLYRVLYRPGSREVKRIGKVKILLNEKGTGSYTVFRRIYLDPHICSSIHSPILRHEMVHASQLHTADILFMEFASALLWFNPFVFLMKQYIRENHEFLADNLAQDGHFRLSDYLVSLKIQTLHKFSSTIANSFNSSTIKKRIIMLTNRRTRLVYKWLYLLVIPLAAILLAAFQNSADPVRSADREAGTFTRSVSSEVVADPVPDRFPLDKVYLTNITWDFNHEAVHPFTKERVFHGGVDIKAPEGTPVYVTADGEVITAEESEDWGKMISVSHGETYLTVYAHLSRIDVKAGDHVKNGDAIGAVGNTGMSTGPHLHYEVRKYGERVDPRSYY